MRCIDGGRYRVAAICVAFAAFLRADDSWVKSSSKNAAAAM
jgi:hypothetical protein